MGNFVIKNHIREFRLKRGWSQQWLSFKVGVSKNSISSIERGEFNPSLDLAASLCFVF